MIKHLHRIGIFVLIVLTACNGNEPQETSESQLPALVVQIQKQARLYSTECRVHKIITHNDTKQLEGSILNQSFSIPLPLGKRSIAIPIEATVKAYIDFSSFSEDNVRLKNGKLELILPDPQIEITSTRVAHKEVRQHVPLLRSRFSDEELTQLEHAGREAIVKDLPHLNLTETARRNAAHVLIPMLAQMGFSEDQITITFRKQFTASDISSLIMKKTE